MAEENRKKTVEVDIPPQAPPIEEEPVQKVTAVPQGARRAGYFKDRDYGEE